jgi:hypothetical protein
VTVTVEVLAAEALCSQTPAYQTNIGGCQVALDGGRRVDGPAEGDVFGAPAFGPELVLELLLLLLKRSSMILRRQEPVNLTQKQ